MDETSRGSVEVGRTDEEERRKKKRRRGRDLEKDGRRGGEESGRRDLRLSIESQPGQVSFSSFYESNRGVISRTFYGGWIVFGRPAESFTRLVFRPSTHRLQVHVGRRSLQDHPNKLSTRPKAARRERVCR